MNPTAVFVVGISILQYLQMCFAGNNPTYGQLRKLCLVIALPGRRIGMDLNDFKKIYDKHLEAERQAIFGSILKEKVIETATSHCSNIHDISRKCAYLRLYRIRDYLIEDVQTLKYKMKAHARDAPFMYSVLLSAWYFDKILLSLKCGPVSNKNFFLFYQWHYFAKFSNKMSLKEEFCRWVLPFGKDVAKNIRREVKNICDLFKSEPICQHSLMFDVIDSLSNLCTEKFSDFWNPSSIHFRYYQDAAVMAFYVMRAHAPTNLKKNFNSNTELSVVKESMFRILTELNREFKTGDLKLAEKILQILPKALHFPCDLMAEYPSIGWLNCAFSRTINQIRSYLIHYWKGSQKSVNALIPKGVVSNIDYREYIKNVRATNIMQLIQKSSTDLAIVAADIKNNIQDRFKQLGDYFRKVSSFDLKKRNADVVYLQDRIKLYRTTLSTTTDNMARKLTGLLAINIAVSFADLHQAVKKMMIRIIKEINPANFDEGYSGNADSILESATEIAEATLKLTKALKKIAGYIALQDYTNALSRKLKQNQQMIGTIGEILKKIKSSQNFEKNKDDFLKSYKGYSPAVRKDEIEKLKSFWDGFIDDLCSSIQDTNSVGAALIRGLSVITSGPVDRCVDAKMEAAALVTCIEEIYDFQFELVETMASIVQSSNQIESSKILGSGVRSKYPNNLSTRDIQIMAMTSSISYSIVQAVNVFMLCNIMEYESGGRLPDECNGLSTDIDKLLSLKSPKCHSELKYVTVPTTWRSDHSWLDISKLYSNELVRFQIPNSQWLVDNGWITDSQRNFAFYVKELEVFLPAIVKTNRQVIVNVRPMSSGYKLRDDTRTVYTVSPSHILKTSYSIGGQVFCRQTTFPNPYHMCRSERKKHTEICLHSLRDNCVKIRDRLFPSIYSLFYINVEGYKNDYIDAPVTNRPIKVALTFCYINPKNLFGSRKRDTKRMNKLLMKRQSEDTFCCPKTTKHMYYEEKEKKCKKCPPGSKSFYSGFFCGTVVKLMITSNVEETFTYDKAVKTCQSVKSVIADANTLKEAKRLGSKEKTCGWIRGKLVKAVDGKCKGKSASVVKHVYCKTHY